MKGYAELGRGHEGVDPHSPSASGTFRARTPSTAGNGCNTVRQTMTPLVS